MVKKLLKGYANAIWNGEVMKVKTGGTTADSMLTMNVRPVRVTVLLIKSPLKKL
jgi:hypothetical protein